MVVIPTERELESIRLDLVYDAKMGNCEKIRGAAMILKRMGCLDLVHIIRDYVLENTNWHSDGEMIPSDKIIYRNINENMR